MKKRGLCILLVLLFCLCLALTACGPSESPLPPGSPTPTPWWISPTPGPETTADPDDYVVFYVGDEAVYYTEFYFFYSMQVYNYYYNGGGADNGLDISGAGSGWELSYALGQQQYPGSDGTWDDVFMENTKDDLHLAVAMYQEAKAAGYTMRQWENDNIQGFFDSLTQYSQQEGVSEAEMLQDQYGQGLTVERVREFQRRYWMGMGFESNQYENAAYTDEELSSYYNEYQSEAADLPDCCAVSVRHILMTNTQSARDVLEKFEQTDKSEDTFAELAKLYTEDSQSQEYGGLYVGMTPQNTADSFNDVEKWMFDNVRQPGDYTLIAFEGGNQLIFFVDKGDPMWKLWCRSRMWDEYAQQIMDKYPFAYPDE